ncbi:MAG: glycosyltransferase family A protein [Verrucomicrobiales bacterium]|nr:glycosyltransferase family A protein [Verrucomicrobiales bacterium]
MPDVVIVIPVFNRADCIVRAVNSVLAQTYDSYSLVVVDDGSECDLSEAQQLVEESGHQWLRLPVNRGVAAARNEGVKRSSARWVSFLDSDDEWEPDKLEAQWIWHQENPATLISQVSEDWYRNGTLFSKPGYLRQASGDLFEASCQRCAIGPSCVMMSREIWDQSGGFDERFRVCEDYALWLWIASRYHVGLIPGESLVKKHGGHEDQLSVKTPLMERYRFLALLEWIRDHPEDRKRIETARKSLLHFGQQLRQYGEKHELSAWSQFFAGVDLSGTVAPAAIEEAWSVLHGEWRNPSERGI